MITSKRTTPIEMEDPGGMITEEMRIMALLKVTLDYISHPIEGKKEKHLDRRK